MSSELGNIHRKEKDAKLMHFICIQCGKSYSMTYGSIRHHKDGYIQICRKCKLKNANKNMSPEQKRRKALQSLQNISGLKSNDIHELSQAIAENGKNRWAVKTPEEQQQHAEISRTNMTHYWETIPANVAELRAQRSAKILKEWRSNATIEEITRMKHKESEAGKRRWANMSDYERTKASIVRSRNTKRWHMNMSDEERSEWKSHVSEGIIKWWNHMTPEERLIWDINRAIGHQKSITNENDYMPPTELEFARILNILKISYDRQSSNVFKHPDFDTLFPFNPIVHSSMVSFMYNWDFRIYLQTGEILVDIDGSIHDGNKYKSSKMKYGTSGEIVSMSEFIAFNDSKRPYQTDGLRAYVINALNDKLTPDTIVHNITNDTLMPLDAFISLIEFESMNLAEQKEILKLACNN